jgi:hypothetical protein
MTSIEERVRAAAQATASRVQQVRPLQLPAKAPATPRRRAPRPAGRPPRPGRWQGWLAPLAAAAAIVAVASVLIAVHNGQNDSGPRPATPSPSPASPQQPAAMVTPACGGPAVAAAPEYLPSDTPQYFAELCGAGLTGRSGQGRLVVADTRTGAVLGSVPGPSGHYQFTAVYGGADGQAFLVTGDHATSTGARMALWAVRLAPGTAHPVSLRLLPWTFAGPVSSISLSPDATQVAVAGAQVRVYSLATGAVLRTWTYHGTLAHVEWTGDGHALAYQLKGKVISVRTIATPGSDLSAGSTPLLTISPKADFPSTPCGGTSGWLISADGTTLVCPENGTYDQSYNNACGSPARGQLAFLRFAPGSKLPGTAPVGTDYSVTVAADPCGNPASVSLWWACADGTEVIGQVSYAGRGEVGIFYDGTYVPMPALGNWTPSPWMMAF